jgi:hypothetical protein
MSAIILSLLLPSGSSTSSLNSWDVLAYSINSHPRTDLSVSFGDNFYFFIIIITSNNIKFSANTPYFLEYKARFSLENAS